MSLFDMSLVFGRFLSCQDKFVPVFLVSQMLFQHLVTGGVHLSFVYSTLRFWTSSSGSLPLKSALDTCLRLVWLFLFNLTSIEFDTVDFLSLVGIDSPPL